jgi:aspartyl-tRNA(Asn)/glutamyl-tRNA(Gln) amidotransferase subunit C
MNEPIDKLARIARLNLTKEERERFAKQLDGILEAFSILAKAPTKGVEPALHPVVLQPARREDKAKPGLKREQAVANSQHTEEGFFKGPKVK